MVTSGPPAGLQPIFIFDSPRTRSHLFARYISTVPNVRAIYHPFLTSQGLGKESFMLRAKTSDARHKEIMRDIERFDSHDTNQTNSLKLEEALKSAVQEGKTPLINEHLCHILQPSLLFSLFTHPTPSLPTTTNPTLIPDPIFHTLTPIILIRHPIHIIDSWKRLSHNTMSIKASDEDFQMGCSLLFHHWLYDFFVSDRRKVVVVDGDDVVHDTYAFTISLCRELGIGTGQISQTWDKWPEEDRVRDPGIRIWLEAFYESEGIVRAEVKILNTDLDSYRTRWVERYGDEETGRLVELVEDNMGHYEYLSRFKI